MKFMKLLSVFVALAILQGCEEAGEGDSGTEVTTTLENIADPNRSAMRGLFYNRGVDDADSDMTVESLTIPILTVGLGTGDDLGGGEEAIVYHCDSENAADCLVDLNGSALSNLLSTGNGENIQDIPEGTYTSVTVSTCTSSGTYEAQVNASGVLNGTTYYTKTGSETMVTSSAEQGPVTINYSGCKNYSILDKPVVVGADPIELNLYIDLADLIHMIDPTDGPDTYTCSGEPSGSTDTDPYICMTYPNVSGNVGTPPTLERYRLEVAGQANAASVIGLFFDEDGNPVGGYGRLLFDGTNYYNRPDDGPYGFKRAFINESDELVITDYTPNSGDTNFNTISGNGDRTMVGFPRDLSTVGSNSTVDYVDRDGNAVSTFTVTRID